LQVTPKFTHICNKTTKTTLSSRSFPLSHTAKWFYEVLETFFHVTDDILTVALKKTQVFWNVMPCHLVNSYHHL